MTSVVLPLSTGSTIYVSLFKFWRANRFCLVMFSGESLALERITVPICGCYVLVLMGGGRWLTLFG